MGKRKVIYANEAAKRLQKVLGGKKTAKAHLIDLLRDGDITLHAKHVIYADDSDDFTHQSNEAFDADIPCLEWWRSVQWERDLESWNWRAGKFHVTTSKKRKRVTRIEGASFKPEDISRIQLEFSSAPKRGGGRRPHTEKWIKLAEALVKAARMGMFERGARQSALLLHADVVDLVSDTGIDSSFTPVFASLYKTFVDTKPKVELGFAESD